jgi:hypothetical protein
MKKQPKISEILHLAADEYLWTGYSKDPRNLSIYSCFAIDLAIDDLDLSASRTGKLFKGLGEMGLDIGSITAFEEFRYGPQRQAARYAWLKFAAMIAEEQGV